jgi:SAM-dependent methyltransferase
MKLIEKLRNWLYEPRVHGVNVDDISLLNIHMEILREKPLLKSAFISFYTEMMKLNVRFLTGSGLQIELGTGAGFFKNLLPQLVTSDIRKGQHIDIALDAQNMTLDDNAVRCIYAINVFHHLPNPERFFSELCRVLTPGGGCILIEPHNGFCSAMLHRNLHIDEVFLPNAKDWMTNDITGPLSGANQALSYIVFERDIARFNELYGENLEVVFQGYISNYLRYLFSGGLNFRQLLPSIFEPVLRLLEQALKPISRHFSLHQIIVIRRH